MISVVVPAYNEEELLHRTVGSLAQVLARLSSDGWEILIVDDGSTDTTTHVTARLAADPRCRVVRHPRNLGKGAAVRTGVLLSRGDRVLICDADLSTPAEALADLLAALEGGATIAVGCRWGASSRVARPQPPLRRVLGRIYRLSARIVTGLPLTDFNCGFKLFRGDEARELFAAARLQHWVWDAEVLTLATRRGWLIREVGVPWSHRPRSRVRPWRDGLWSIGELCLLAVRSLRAGKPR